MRRVTNLSRDAVAVVLSLASVLSLHALPAAPYTVLVLPVLLAAYVGGARSGIIATFASAVAALCFIAHPTEQLHDALALIALVVVGGTVSAMCEMMHSARRRSERSEHLYSKSFRASPVPIALMDFATGHILDCNAAYSRLTGWSREEMRGLHLGQRNIAIQPERELVRGRLQRDGLVHDIPCGITRKDGTRRDVLLSAILVDLEGKPHSITTLVDVTDQKRAESAVHESETRFRELAETIDEVFWLTSADKQQTHYVSPAFERVWGISCESVYAAPWQWLQAVHPDDRELVISDAMKLAGSELEFRIIRPDGEVRWIHDRSFPVRDSAGNLVRMAGVAVDVTDRRKLEEELQHAQRMESLGRLAGGVAHDFNNVLAVIATNASMLGEMVPEHGEPHEMVTEIEQAVNRAGGLTRQLLAFSRKQTIEPVVLDLNTVVCDTRKMLRRMIGEDVALETSLEPDLAHVKMDAGHLVQVLMNLAVNARDAMPRGGKLSITTRNLDGSVPHIELAVADTGCGMPPEVRARIFEPFFTTKGAGKGTGMGLAVVHGIVQQAGGRIDVDTVEGVGTTFRLYLPVVDAPVEAPTGPARATARGIETVLVVDDDAHVRSATTRALRSNGYHTLDAADGASALHMLENRRFDLLVTDVVMPGMNGRELAEAARSSNPQLKVLFTSGYTDDEVVARGVMRGEVALLEKPFRMSALALKVREVLDRGDESLSGGRGQCVA